MEEVIFISAAELSADMYAASLLKELNLKAFGIGGENLRGAGLEVLYPMEELQLAGIFELLPRLKKIRYLLKKLPEEIEKRKPLALVLVDFPDFHLMLAKRIKKRLKNIPVIHYISPTVWAWRMGRLKKIKKLVDLELLIFPFEREIYRKWEIPHCFVGHPLMERLYPELPEEKFREKHNINKKFIAVLPGSRPHEIKHHARTLKKFAEIFRKKYPNMEIVLPVAPTLKKEIRKYPLEEFHLIYDDRYSAMAYAEAALAASGTAPLEVAFLATPLLAFYKVSLLTSLFRPLIKLKYYSIVNIIAGREIIKEFYQEKFKPEKMLMEVERLLEDKDYRNKMLKEFEEIKGMFPRSPASKIAARAIKTLIEEGPGRLDEVCRGI